MITKGILSMLLIGLFLLAGCKSQVDSQEPGSLSQAEPNPIATQQEEQPFLQSPKEQTTPSQSSAVLPFQTKQGNSYIQGLAEQIAKEITSPQMNQAEKAQAAYRYVIANTWFGQPVGLDAWRLRGDDGTASYLENRGLSPLAFGVGSCEDYAAALVLLLQNMGIEARYMPGLTISVDGRFVDHAWVVAKIDGVWYHLDPQLEDNVTRNNLLTYRFFLKSDQAMLADHRWGENLLHYATLSNEQQQEVREQYLAPPCPASAPQLPPETLAKRARPDRGALEKMLEEERSAYRQQYGDLEPIELNIIPPVFGEAGYP